MPSAKHCPKRVQLFPCGGSIETGLLPVRSHERCMMRPHLARVRNTAPSLYGRNNYSTCRLGKFGRASGGWKSGGRGRRLFIPAPPNRWKLQRAKFCSLFPEIGFRYSPACLVIEMAGLLAALRLSITLTGRTSLVRMQYIKTVVGKNDGRRWSVGGGVVV